MQTNQERGKEKKLCEVFIIERLHLSINYLIQIHQALYYILPIFTGFGLNLFPITCIYKALKGIPLVRETSENETKDNGNT